MSLYRYLSSSLLSLRPFGWRIAIGPALVRDSKILLLNKATAGLDADSRSVTLAQTSNIIVIFYYGNIISTPSCSAIIASVELLH